MLSTDFIHGAVSDHPCDEKCVLRFTRLLVVGIGLLCIGIGLGAPGIYEIVIFGFALLFAGLFRAVVCGLFRKRANAPAGIASMLSGFATVVLGCISPSVEAGAVVVTPPDNAWTVFFTFVPVIVSGIAMYGVATLTQASHPRCRSKIPMEPSRGGRTLRMESTPRGLQVTRACTASSPASGEQGGGYNPPLVPHDRYPLWLLRVVSALSTAGRPVEASDAGYGRETSF